MVAVVALLVCICCPVVLYSIYYITKKPTDNKSHIELDETSDDTPGISFGLGLHHKDLPRNRPGKLHSLPADTLELGVKTNAAHVDNGNELSMGADTPDCPTGSTVMAGMGAGKTCS